MYKHLLRPLLSLGCLVIACRLLGQVEETPILVVNMNSHAATVNRISCSGDGKLIMSVSNDRTARIWNTATGRLLKILRVPISDKDIEGRLYAGALSPTGDTAVVGGRIGFTYGDHHGYCYLFDTRTGNIINKIGPFADCAYDIRFSHNGAYIALGLGGGLGARVYDCRHGSLTQLPGINCDVYRLAFNVNGDLAVGGTDGLLRLFNSQLHQVGSTRFFGGRPFITSLSFSPDGKKLLLGQSNSPLQIRDAQTLEISTPADVAALGDRRLAKADFSADSKSILSGGRLDKTIDGAPHYYLRLLKDFSDTAGTHIDINGGYDYLDNPVNIYVSDIISLKDGTFAYCCNEPEWGRIDGNGKILYQVPYDANDFKRSDKHRLFVNEDGSAIGFVPENGDSMVFSIKKESLRKGQLDAPTPRDHCASIRVSNWQGRNSLSINDVPVSLETNELCWSVDIPWDESCALVGASYQLLKYDKQGKNIWTTGLPSDAWCVKTSGNGRYAVAALGDGTIRWYDMDNGKQLLSFYPDKDGTHWIIWTSKGYYNCAPGSERMLGWNVNQGDYKAPLFYPESKFREIYRNAAVVDSTLTTKDEESAIASTDNGSSSWTPNYAVRIRSATPPSVSINAPCGGLSVDTNVLTIDYQINEANGQQPISAQANIDGVPVHLDNNVNNGLNHMTIRIPHRDFSLTITATNDHGESEADPIPIHWKDAQQQAESLPEMQVLVVGLDYTYDKDLKLNYAVADATAFASDVKKQEGFLYRKVDTTLLLNEKATKANIQDAIQRLSENAGTGNTIIFYISGHGVPIDKSFFFLPYKADQTREYDCLSADELFRHLNQSKGIKVFFLDACRSGALIDQVGINLATTNDAPNMGDLADELTKNVTGTVVFTSCRGGQSSYECAQWKHGAFTKQLLEGIDKDTLTVRKNKISVSSLDSYLEDAVEDLVKDLATKIGKTYDQRPIMTRNPKMGDFPLFERLPRQ